MKLTFIAKNEKLLFEPPVRYLVRGNVRIMSIAHWKTRDRLYNRHNLTFLLSLTVETLYAEIGRSRRFSKEVGYFERRFQTEGGIAHQPLLM